MIIWGSLLIPLVVAVVLLCYFRHRTVWWEFLIPVVVSLVLILLSKLLITSIQTSDTEYLTSWAERAEYYEDWSELVTETYTDSKGNVHTRTRVAYHGPEWWVQDGGGKWHSVSSYTYERLARKFGNTKFESVFRFATIVKDGGKYVTLWPKQESTLEVISYSRYYTNRVQASPSVFGFRKIGKEEKAQYGLFDYPRCQELQQPSMLGWEDWSGERTLSVWNAKLGANSQIRIWLLVFTDQPLEAAVVQESYWQGGNKNELVLCVGVNGEGKVQWGHVFSWTEREEFKINVRDCITDQLDKKFNPTELVNRTAALVPGGWQRKEFKDFDYLTVEPPTWSVVLVFLLTLAVNCGISWWVIVNEHRPVETKQPQPLPR